MFMNISSAIYVGSAGALKYVFPAQGPQHWFCFTGVSFGSSQAKPLVFLGLSQSSQMGARQVPGMHGRQTAKLLTTRNHRPLYREQVLLTSVQLWLHQNTDTAVAKSSRFP